LILSGGGHAASAVAVCHLREVGCCQWSEVDTWVFDDADHHIRPTDILEMPHGSPWLGGLYDDSAPVRHEIIDRKIFEAEVNADIDAAIAAVRASRGTDRR
jgi:hypothetical protein